MTQKILSILLCLLFIVSCNSEIATENGSVENKTATETDSLDQKAAKEIKTIFGAESCEIMRHENVATIKCFFTGPSFKEEDLSVMAFAFYQLSLRYKLKPCEIIKVALKDNEGTEYSFRSSDFKDKAECFETVEKIGDLLFDRKYDDLKKFMDSQRSAETERAIKLFMKADSISGKINNFSIISIQFGMAITRINVKADHANNFSTYYSFGFNKNTNKLQYLDVAESNSGNVQIR